VGVTYTFTNKYEEQPWGFLEEFKKKNTIERLKTVEKIVLCVVFNYASLAKLNNVFRKFQVIHKL